MAMEQGENSKWYAFFTRDGEKLIRFVQSRARRISEMDAEDIVADVAVDAVLREQVDRPAEYPRQFVAHSLQGNQADPGFWRNVDEHINVAVWPEIPAQGGTKDR